LVRFGILFIALGVLGLCVLIVIPVLPPFETNAGIDNMLRPLICQEGEAIERQQYSEPSREGGTSFSMNVYCIDQEATRRDETGRWALIGAGVFIVPFLLGLFGVIAGSSQNARSDRSRSATISMQNMAGFTPTGIGSSPTLTERLKQIQQARDAGMITSEEYERLRKEALDALS
jgi:hypothetical protein